MKKYPSLSFLVFLLLVFLFGCGSPPQSIGGGQSSQNAEALPAPETPVAIADNPPSSQQELTSPEGASSLPEDGIPENVFAVFGDGKLIAAWSTDAEGNSYPISKERAEKLIPSDFVEKMKYCKDFNAPQLSRTPVPPNPELMDSSNAVAYKTDQYLSYTINFNNIPNPCSTPFVFALGWVSPDPSENTITRYAPVPACTTGGMLKYTSGERTFNDLVLRWSKIEPDSSDWDEGGIFPMPSLTAWRNGIRLLSMQNLQRRKLSLGQWQIPSYAGSTCICPTFMMRQLAVENLSAEPDPSGGYIIKGDVVVLPDRPQPPADLNWTVTIYENNQPEIVYTKEGTGDKIEVAWDGNAVVASKDKIPEPIKDLAHISIKVQVVALKEKTHAEAEWRLSTIEIWTKDYPSPSAKLIATSAKLIATSDSNALQNKLLNQVFIPARQGNSVMVVVRNPPSSWDVKVKVNTTKTDQPELALPLPPETFGTVRYQELLYFGPTQISGPQLFQLAITNNPGGNQTTFTWLDHYYKLSDSKEFASEMSSSNVFPPYPSKRLEMGHAIGPSVGVANLANTDEIKPSVSAFQAAGFEEVTVSLPENPDIKARFRVKNEAKVFYVNCHGRRKENVLRLSDGPTVYLFAGSPSCPPNMEPTDWGNNLRTIILYACEVLDINDYNDNYFKASVKRDFSPGEKWDKIASIASSNKILLGYNSKGATGNFSVSILSKYFNLIKGGTSEPEAWLRANASISDKYADTACAIDKGYYYFIKYEKYDQFGQTPMYPDPDAPHHWDRTFYKISRKGTDPHGKRYWDIPWIYLPKGAAVPLPNQDLKDF